PTATADSTDTARSPGKGYGTMATRRLRGRPVHPVGLGGVLAGLLWAAGCSTPPVNDRLVPPRVFAPADVPLTAQHKSAPPDPGGAIQQVRYGEEAPPSRLLPSGDQPSSDRHPIDLPTALRLAGANNLQIARAAERIRQAQARREGAEYQWLPSLDVGVSYTEHDGRVQDTRGQIIDTRRHALSARGRPHP